jgi:hypothetical protein
MTGYEHPLAAQIEGHFTRRLDYYALITRVISRRLGFEQSQVAIYHLVYERWEIGFVPPSQTFTRLRGIPEQPFHLSRAEITGIDSDEHLAGLGVDTLLVDATAAPSDPASHMGKGKGDEFTH